MRIKSTFKDYYDFVEHKYGGDEHLLYKRSRIGILKDDSQSHETIELKNASILPLPNDYRSKDTRNPGWWSFKWLAVAGRYYLLAGFTKTGCCSEDFRVLHRQHHAELIRTLSRPTMFSTEYRTIDSYLGVRGEGLDTLSRVLNQPVFVVKSVRNGWGNSVTVEVANRIPVLSDLGFATLKSPELLYQEIASYFMTTLEWSPEQEAPCKIEDKYRITQHGFDMKTSFRHPINIRKG